MVHEINMSLTFWALNIKTILISIRSCNWNFHNLIFLILQTITQCKNNSVMDAILEINQLHV